MGQASRTGSGPAQQRAFFLLIFAFFCNYELLKTVFFCEKELFGKIHFHAIFDILVAIF